MMVFLISERRTITLHATLLQFVNKLILVATPSSGKQTRSQKLMVSKYEIIIPPAFMPTGI